MKVIRLLHFDFPAKLGGQNVCLMHGALKNYTMWGDILLVNLPGQNLKRGELHFLKVFYHFKSLWCIPDFAQYRIYHVRTEMRQILDAILA